MAMFESKAKKTASGDPRRSNRLDREGRGATVGGEIRKSLKGRMVGAARFELATSCTRNKRASQATLRPDLGVPLHGAHRQNASQV